MNARDHGGLGPLEKLCQRFGRIGLRRAYAHGE
jgi:hypothetical protein